MKKSNVRLSLNKKRISTLKTTEIHGGFISIKFSGCQYTHYEMHTCHGIICATENDCTSNFNACF